MLVHQLIRRPQDVEFLEASPHEKLPVASLILIELEETIVAETVAGSDLGHFNDEESTESILIKSIEVTEVTVIEVEAIGIFTELEVLLWLEPIVPAVIPAVVPAVIPAVIPAVVPPGVRVHEDYLLNDE